MNMDRLTDLIPIQGQTYTETLEDYAERKIDCTSDTICGLTRVEFERQVSHYPDECATTALYYHNLFIYQEREIDPGLLLNIFVMLLPPCVHEEVAAAFLLHFIVCQNNHQVHRFPLLLYTYGTLGPGRRKKSLIARHMSKA
jgi:hypothetical protein